MRPLPRRDWSASGPEGENRTSHHHPPEKWVVWSVWPFSATGPFYTAYTHSVHESVCVRAEPQHTQPNGPPIEAATNAAAAARCRKPREGPLFCVILSLFSFSSFFSPRSRGVRALQLRALFLHTQLIVLTTRALLHRFIPRLLHHQTRRLGPFKRDGRHVLTFSTHTHTQATNPTSFFHRRQ